MNMGKTIVSEIIYDVTMVIPLLIMVIKMMPAFLALVDATVDSLYHKCKSCSSVVPITSIQLQ